MNMQQHKPLAWDFCPLMSGGAVFVGVHCPFLNRVHSQEMWVSELPGREEPPLIFSPCHFSATESHASLSHLETFVSSVLKQNNDMIFLFPPALLLSDGKHMI